MIARLAPALLLAAALAGPALGQPPESDRLPPVRAGEPVDGAFTYCVNEAHLREMAAFESGLAERGAGRAALIDRYGDWKTSECGYAPFEGLVFLDRAFAWRGYDVDGRPTDWEAWEVETAEWGLHLFVIIERGWVLVGEPT